MTTPKDVAQQAWHQDDDAEPKVWLQRTYLRPRRPNVCFDVCTIDEGSIHSRSKIGSGQDQHVGACAQPVQMRQQGIDSPASITEP